MRTCPAYAFPYRARVDGQTLYGSTRASRLSSRLRMRPAITNSISRPRSTGRSTGSVPTGRECRPPRSLELQSAVRLGYLADLRDARHLRIALAAVIEDENGRLSYWGLRHPPGKPDFHHPNGFALEVARA